MNEELNKTLDSQRSKNEDEENKNINIHSIQ